MYITGAVCMGRRGAVEKKMLVFGVHAGFLVF